MANAILNFHFDYWHTSLTKIHCPCMDELTIINTYRATLSNCNALYYHMNYVHSGAVEPMDIIRKMVTSDTMVKQEHLE